MDEPLGSSYLCLPSAKIPRILRFYFIGIFPYIAKKIIITIIIIKLNIVINKAQVLLFCKFLGTSSSPILSSLVAGTTRPLLSAVSIILTPSLRKLFYLHGSLYCLGLYETVSLACCSVLMFICDLPLRYILLVIILKFF